MAHGWTPYRRRLEAYIPSDAGLSPDDTQARRMQVGIRFVF